jgi:hypothetical protein
MPSSKSSGDVVYERDIRGNWFRNGKRVKSVPEKVEVSAKHMAAACTVRVPKAAKQNAPKEKHFSNISESIASRVVRRVITEVEGEDPSGARVGGIKLPSSAVELKELVVRLLERVNAAGAEDVAEWISYIDEAEAAFLPFDETFETIASENDSGLGNIADDNDVYGLAEELNDLVLRLGRYWSDPMNFGPDQKPPKVNFKVLADGVFERLVPSKPKPRSKAKQRQQGPTAKPKQSKATKPKRTQGPPVKIEGIIRKLDNGEAVFPDSKGGVLGYLKDDTTLKWKKGAVDVKFVADPQVEGVWKVSVDPKLNDGVTDIIVYLAGYKDPMGKIRQRNDFETFEQADDRHER